MSSVGIRERILEVATYLGLCLVVLTEALSYFSWLNFLGLAIGWLIIIVLGIKYFPRQKRGFYSPLKSYIVSTPKSRISCLFFILGILFLITLVAAPNTWDSMTYHLARVEHWIQNESIFHYPTHIDRQLYNPPFAEYVIVNLRILTGTDYFSNFVQYFSFLGSLIAVSVLAKNLGAKASSQGITVLIALTLPMGVLQASSTQNDLVVAFWVLSFLCFGYQIFNTPNRSKYWVLAGISLGLAVLTKGTAYIYIFPFLVLFIFLSIKLLGWKSIRIIGIIAAIAFLVNVSHFYRNYQTFSSPLGSPGGYTNEVISLKVLGSNALRNLSLHLSTPFGAINSVIEKQVYKLHTSMAMDVSDPKTSWQRVKYKVKLLSNHEDTAGNLLHIIALMFSIIFVLAHPKLRMNKNLLKYTLAFFGVILTFLLVLKWQPWHSRLHLPIFLLGSVIIGFMVSCFPKNIQKISLGLLLLGVLPWVIFNNSRPIFFSVDRQLVKEKGKIQISSSNIWNTSRELQYFNNQPYLYQPYKKASEYIIEQSCEQLGLILDEDSYEYPLWRLLQKNSEKDYIIRHVKVSNDTLNNDYGPGFKTPCLILTADISLEAEIYFMGQTYRKAWTETPINIYQLH